MAWKEALDEQVFSIGVAPQSDLNTVGTVFTWIDCEMAQVSYDAAQTEQSRSRRSRGSRTPRKSGRVWPRLAIRFPACGQLTTYDPTANTPSLRAAMSLLDAFGGSSAMAYQLAGVEPDDGNHVDLVTSTGKIGCLLAALSGGKAIQGFIKAITGAGTPWNAELFEDLAEEPGAASARLPTLTLWPGTTAPTPLTIRISGEDAAMARTFVGCTLATATASFDADWRLYWQVELVAYGGEAPRGAAGGLQAVTETLEIEPLLERGGARFVVASNVFGDLVDSTVDPEGTCDVRDFELTIEWPHYTAICPPATQGVGEVVQRSPTITCQFSLLDVSDFEDSGGENFAQQAWQDGSSFSLSLYMGDTPGRLMSFNLPRLHLTAYPEPVFVDGLRHLRMQCEAGDYSGDGASTDAGNKPLRIGIG